MERLELNGPWKFRLASAPYPSGIPDGLDEWMPAKVPGTVHQDLMANGTIADPFVGMNERDVQWVDLQRWTYRREFVVPASFTEFRTIDLVAEGLDTYAEIRINGKRAGRTDNMFVGHRFDVKTFLHEGANILEVTFDSPTNRSRALERRLGALQVAQESHRVYVRKAQYSFSWDWGPKLTTSGIWRSVRLEAADHPVLRHPFVRVGTVTQKEARLYISVEVERTRRSGLSLEVAITGPEADVRRRVKAHSSTVRLGFSLPQPRLWWPSGYGSQPLYKANFSLYDGEQVLQTIHTTFAVRTVRLLQKRDPEGKSFVVEVNGVPIFCKGADWIPADTFLPRITDETYVRLLTLARDAHMNMVRVWGGGIYEQEIFYETCDRLGLMVWQDFMFACGEYPEEPWFLRSVKEEAEEVVRRLRNHPSIVLWCGNNECEWNFTKENPGLTPNDMCGAGIFRDLLRKVVRELDGTRPYWRSSPFGDGPPNSHSNGNRHQWEVWSFWKDYPEYELDFGRFITEFGFQAPANVETMAAAVSPQDRHPQSPTMEFHNKQAEGTERLFRFQAAHFGVTTDFDAFIERGQLIQAFALTTAVEHWRRRKFRTAGALFWQLNDCWPVSSWSVIDSALRPKAAYYAAKRFYAPVLLSLKRTDQVVEAWGINDRLRALSGSLRIRVLSFDGRELETRETDVRMTSNSAAKLKSIDVAGIAGFDPASSYIAAYLLVENEPESESRVYFAEPKHVRLPRFSIDSRFDRDHQGAYQLYLTSNTLVRGLRFRVEGEDTIFSDNCFDMDPGKRKTVTFVSLLDERSLRKRLRAASMSEGVITGNVRTDVGAL